MSDYIEASSHDLMFKFAQKNLPSPNSPEDEILLFHNSSELPIKYVSFLHKYRKLLRDSYFHVDDLLSKMEIPDLAILDVGQLQSDKEELSSYLNWLTSEYFFVSLNKDLKIYDESKNLPELFNTKLTGLIGPSNGINEIFSSISMYEPAEQAHQTADKKFPLQLYFGDVICLGGVDEESRFTCQLVISQTCDMVHCNISNNHVLFVEGTATKIHSNSEPLMFWETAKQVNKKANDGMLVKLSGKLFKIEWNIKELRTITQSNFLSFTNENYLGRLNELFALQIQRAALDHVGRIGLPIKPAQTIVYTKFEFSAYENDSLIEHYSAQSVCWLIFRAVKSDNNRKITGHISQKLLNELLGFLNTTRAKINEGTGKLHIKVDNAINTLQNHMNVDQWKIECNNLDAFTSQNSTLTVNLISESDQHQQTLSSIIYFCADGFKPPNLDGKNRLVIKFSDAFTDGLKQNWSE